MTFRREVKKAALLAALPCLAGETQRLLDLDLYSRLNPAGLQLAASGALRNVSVLDATYGVPTAYFQAGGTLAFSPSTGQASLHLEAQPALFVKLRVQGDWFRFFGRYWALLSFPDGASPYGQSRLDERKGEEISAWGRRLLVQPTFQAQLGPVLLRNQVDGAWYRFQGPGPFFYEQEYDLLLKDGDALLANRTQALCRAAAWKGTLYSGLFYEWTEARAAKLHRRRLGLLGFWEAGSAQGKLGRPRFFLQTGFNLEDPNRRHQAFLVAGAGSSF